GLELGPLVVGGPDGNLDIDGFDDGGHGNLRGRIAAPGGAGNRNAHHDGGRSDWADGGASRSALGPKGQTAPRPERVRPVTAFTTTTTRIAPMTETTIELRSSGPSIGFVLKRTLAR